VAYQSQISLKARSAVIAAVVAIHVGLLLALLNLSGKNEQESAQSALRIIDIRQWLPPQLPRHQSKRAKPRAKPATPEPNNLKSAASPVFTPKPQIQTPKVQQVEATQTPREGTSAAQGASSSAGPGTGAGGSGQGNGAGGSGTGGDNGVVEPPRLASPVMSGRDFSPDELMQWPRGATVFLRLRISPNGSVAECVIDRGTAVAAIDRIICNLAHDRLRFRPALNRNGQAVAGWFGYAQPAPR
jgi:protein TonB